MDAPIIFYGQAKKVAVGGTATCPDWPDTQAVEYIYLANKSRGSQIREAL